MKYTYVLSFAIMLAIASAAKFKSPNAEGTFKDVHLEKTENGCHSKNGKWVAITLTDEGGSNGIQMDLVKVDTQKVVKSVKTPVGSKRARDRRLSRRDDVVTFKDEFCLDYYGKDYAPCYDLVTSSQGKNLDELSWSVKVSVLQRASADEKKQGKKDQIKEAKREGSVYDEAKILCGRLFKQLGKFTDRQLGKVDESAAAGKESGDRFLRAFAKVGQKAEELGLSSKK